MLQNKIYGFLMITFGALTVLILEDATFFLFALVIGVGTFFSKENIFDMSLPVPEDIKVEMNPAEKRKLDYLSRKLGKSKTEILKNSLRMYYDSVRGGSVLEERKEG